MLKKKLTVIILSIGLAMSMSTSVFAAELLGNNHFENGVGLPWTEVETAPAHADWDITNGKYNINVTNNGTNKWDVQFRHRGLTIEQNHTYNVQFTIESPVDCKVYAKIGEMGPNAAGEYLEYWHNSSAEWQPFQVKAGVPLVVNQNFTMKSPTSAKCEFAFHVAGSELYNGTVSNATPHKVSFSNIHLDDPQYPGRPAVIPEPTNAIRVNQVGYAPGLNKVATLVSPSTTPVDWSLINSAGTVVKTGKSVVKGADHASGDNVHTIDFSSYTTPGIGYKLSVADSAVDLTKTTVANSMKFSIGNDLYSTMKYNAIKYFYHSRSGVPITMPYADRQDLTRLPGHPSDVLTNAAGTWFSSIGNDTLDVTGGWYDAGDHGKYVVNGGISTWTVYNQYERALYKGDVTAKPIADGTMNIPESGNSVPDILDEARFNTELFLKMQIPTGKAYAGMVHHKAHDEAWTALAIRPDQDAQKRYLQPPSTAATLNMAAVTSQASRLWAKYDKAFADKCLAASKVAWDAAIANPKIYATMDQGTGGGAYGDDNVTDEFYWAASELYITTGEAKYLDYMKANSSDKYLKMPSKLTGGEDKGLTGAFDWGNVAGLGTVSLALVPNGLPAADVTAAQASIKEAADTFIAIENKEGYGVPIEESALSDELSGYAWGSNSFVANNAIVMGYAYDFSKDVKYLNGASTAMDYLLGRNANVQSYVTGYGENPLENPHHRFWSFQADPSFPTAPAGCLSGGPNSGLQDPWVKGSGWKPGVRPAAKCFMDNIESWSTNEITINWNAPLAWMSSYMDEKINSTVIPTPTIMYGDVNGDTKINVFDYIALKKYIAGTITTFPVENGVIAADVNGDGKVNVFDYIMMKKYISGTLASFPAQK
jgi:endoglucanase